MIKAAVLGSTGVVGQYITYYLSKSKFYQPVVLVSSKKMLLKDQWKLPYYPEFLDHAETMPYSIETLKKNGVEIAFSALPAETANIIEKECIENGIVVISNSSNMRLNDNVPLVIPEINGKNIEGKVKIIKTPNCTTSGIALVLHALGKAEIQIKEVFASTYQSLSGNPKQPSYQIFGNIIPFIPNEEEKIQKESNKILNQNIKINVSVARVNVSVGHLISLFIKLDKKYDLSEIEKAFKMPTVKLPSSPKELFKVFNENDRPQPLLDSWLMPTDPIPGMMVCVGRMQLKERVLRMYVLVNNLIRGAAGGTILNGELIYSNNLI